MDSNTAANLYEMSLLIPMHNRSKPLNRLSSVGTNWNVPLTISRDFKYFMCERMEMDVKKRGQIHQHFLPSTPKVAVFLLSF